MTIATKILASAILLALISPAHASYFNEAEPNDTLAQAQSMDSYFSMSYDADIGDVGGINRSTTMAHASVLATGDDTFDYYSFTLSRESTVILDIDYGMQDFDSVLSLWKADGTFFGQNDDKYSPDVVGAGGSVSGFDSFMQTTLQAGTYVVGVALYKSYGADGGWDAISRPVPTGADYTLHATVGAVPEAETYAMMLAGLGLVGFAASRRKLKN